MRTHLQHIPYSAFAVNQEDFHTIIRPGMNVHPQSLKLSDNIINVFLQSVKSLDDSVLLVPVGESVVFKTFHPMLDDEVINKLTVPPEITTIWIPTQIVDNHWTVLSIDIVKKVVWAVDPLFHFDERMIKNAKRVIRGMYAHYDDHFKNIIDNAVIKPWALKMQKSGTMDCGVIICYFCEQFIKKEELNYELNVLEYREKVYETVKTQVGAT